LRCKLFVILAKSSVPGPIQSYCVILPPALQSHCASVSNPMPPPTPSPSQYEPPTKQKRVFSLLIRPFECDDTMCCYRLTRPPVGRPLYTCRRISFTRPPCTIHDQRSRMNPFCINSFPPCPVDVLYIPPPLTVFLRKYI